MSSCSAALNHERSEPKYLPSSEHVGRHDKQWGLGSWGNCQEKKLQGAARPRPEVNCLGEKKRKSQNLQIMVYRYSILQKVHEF